MHFSPRNPSVASHDLPRMVSSPVPGKRQSLIELYNAGLRREMARSWRTPIADWLVSADNLRIILCLVTQAAQPREARVRLSQSCFSAH